MTRKDIIDIMNKRRTVKLGDFMKKTLVILAAGIGSRYGAGIKQLAKMDKNNHIIIDYSIYDAIKAGFEKVVFIIRKDIEKDFKEIIGNRISEKIEVSYAYQSTDLPEGFEKPSQRKKPWGTVPALISCKNIVKEPFLLINADDYYGKEPYADMYKFLDKKSKGENKIALAGYKLKNTLSKNGKVTRGICLTDEKNHLVDIKETHEIFLENGKLSSKENRSSDVLNINSPVSMNMWAFFPEIIDIAYDYYIKYLERNKNNLMEAEYVLPDFVAELLKDKKAKVKLIPTPAKWIGITYKEDLKPAQDAFKELIANKEYPENLWK